MLMVKNTRNAEYTKEYNRKMFLRLLRMAPMSRAEIARRMGLTRAATSLIADELLSEGLIQETTANATHRGRTPVPLTLRHDALYAVGVYLNRDGCIAGIVNMCGDVLVKERLHLEGTGKREKLEILAEAVEHMQRRAQIPREKMIGVGVSAPGPLDGESGIILNPPRFDLWHYTEIGTILQERLGLPIYLENNASCLARYNHGKADAMGSENFLLLLVDSGVGSGVISGGKVLKGAGYFTSELGHTSIDFKGRSCACGNIGCLEAYAAIPNLLRNTPFTSWQEVMDSRQENPGAMELVELETDYLAAGIANMTNIVSLDTVLLAGELLYGAAELAPILERKVNSRILRRNILPVRVLPSCSGTDSEVLAAADVAFGRFLVV